MSRKRQPRRLSNDDLAIWRRVTGTANPLHPATKTHTREEPQEQRPAPASEAVSDPVPRFRIGQHVSYDHSKGHNLTPTLEARLATQPVRMDRKTFGKMKRGKLRPERKIDLHGMTLAQAHPALSRFLISAHADGCRLVLVVTGKGSRNHDDGGPIPMPRGVLRNQVPQWLRMAPLASLVLQVSDAHQSHGGSGAYYVYLSRRR
ncbi:Smr/MutS family protein [Tropicimonas marinistellae]|uniref:Smr/MutS family protein n=1 Tax=Tropicimonas marinistellae TaxID=1739787 RepID=UPI000835D797|nr:Smr/MutS family protein [Tropicimonas marinistellae]